MFRASKFAIRITLVCVMLLMYGCSQQEKAADDEKYPVINKVVPFELDSTTGDVYHSDNGKVKLISFILMNCPDGACPTTMNDFAKIQNELKEKGLFGSDVELLAITFDPKRDDMERFKQYSENFAADPGGWHFLRTSEARTKEITDDFDFQYDLGDAEMATHESSIVIHSTTMYILDAEHQVRATHQMSIPDSSEHEREVSHQMDIDQIVNDLEYLVDEGKEGEEVK